MNALLKLQVPIAALVAGFSIGVSRHILPVVYPSMQSITGIMNTQLGLLTSAYYFSYMLFALLFGFLSDHVNSRLMITTSCFVISAGSFGMGFSNSSTSLLAFSIVAGMGAGGLYVPMVSLLLKKYINQRGFITSLVLTGEGISGITIGIVIPYIVFSWDWRYVWWLFGLMVILFGFYLWLTLENVPPESISSFGSRVRPTLFHRKKSTHSTPRSEARGMLRVDTERRFLPRFKNRGLAPSNVSKEIWVLGLIYFSHAITRGIFVTFAVAYLVGSGWSFRDASMAFSFMAIGFIPGASFAGALVDRFNHRSVLMALLFLQIICVSMVLLHSNPMTILVFSFIEGICIAGVPTIMGILPTNYFEKERYGKALGFLTLSFGLGVSASPLMGGVIGDLTHSLPSPLLLGLSASFISLGIAFFMLKERVLL